MKYEKYKDSGVEWLGEVPEHWEMRKIKFNFKIYPGATPKTEISEFWDGDIVWITPADYKTVDKFILNGQRTITLQGYNSCNTQLVPKNSLIFSKRAPIGTVAIADVDLCTNQGCLSCVPKNANTLYYYYATSVFTECFDLLGSGATFKEISASDFANVKIPTPPLSEQQAIANYLDAKCAKINGSIDVQKRKIELLNELKQTIITDAVTKGLNPNAPMKNSGVEWLGEVPEHWEVMKTSLVFDGIGSGTTPSTSNKNYYAEDDGLYWLQTGDLNDGNIEDTSKKITQLAVDECKLKFYPSDSVVIAMYGATIGKVGLLKISTATNQACCVLPKSKRCLPSFAFFLFLGAKKQLLVDAMGGGQPNISQDIIKKLKLSLPPLPEQQAIVNYLETETSKIDAQIAKVNRRIELLNELKQSIITEAVTGKIKVC